VKKLLIILAIGILWGSNDIQNCDSNNDRDFMILRFFDLETQNAKKVGFVVTTRGFVLGEGFYSTDSTAIGLPLDPDTESSMFQFDSDTSSFNLTVSYEKEIRIFDPDCDPSFTFLKLDTVSQTFDSTVVRGTVTNRQLDTNVEVYF